VALIHFKRGVMETIAACALGGLAWHLMRAPG
jgi:hypothetical protein